MCESFKSRGLILALAIGLCSSSLGAKTLEAESSCSSALTAFKGALSQSYFKFKPATDRPSHWSRLGGPYKSMAAPMLSNKAWILLENNRYAVVQKNDVGAMFSTPAVDQFQLLESSDIEAQAIAYPEGGQDMVFAFRYLGGESNEIILQESFLRNAATGELRLRPDDPLVISSNSSDGKIELVSRAKSGELWLVDGSNKLRILKQGQEGLGVAAELDFNIDFEFESQLQTVSKVIGVVFDESGDDGRILVETVSGEKFLVDMSVSSSFEKGTDEQQEDSAKLNIKMDFESTVSLDSDVQSIQLHSSSNILLAQKSDSLSLHLWQPRSGEVSALGVKELSIPEGFEFVDLHLFWDGAVATEMLEKKKKQVFYGEIHGALIVKDKTDASHKVVWVSL